MQFWIINSILVSVISIIFTGWLIPKILLIAFRRNLFDKPDERKIYYGLTPRLGGLAFYPVITLSLALVLGLNLLLGYDEILSLFRDNSMQIIFFLCSLTVLYLVGMADDLVGVRYTAKFAVQLISAILLIISGLYVNNFHEVVGIDTIPMWLSFVVTIFVVLFIVNAFNLIDGIDGLASGLGAIACLFYAVVFFLIDEYFYLFVSVATLGVIIPFFYYNVFGDVNKQKKIFMGDTGSLTIGMIFSFLFIKLLMVDDISSIGNFNIFLLAFSPLMIPCFDVVRVVIHRLKNKKNPFLADRNHIHHKLLAVGLSQRKAMMLILLTAFLWVMFNLTLMLFLDVNVVLLIDIAIYTFVNMWLTKKINKQK